MRARVHAAGWNTCFVVDERHVLLGRLGRTALEGTDGSSIEQAMTLGPSTIRPSARLEPVLKRMRDRNLTGLPVTTSGGRLIGLLLREDLERKLHGDSNG